MSGGFVRDGEVDMEKLLHAMYVAGVVESWVSWVEGSVTYYRVYGNGRQIIVGAESGEVFVPLGQESVS